MRNDSHLGMIDSLSSCPKLTEIFFAGVFTAPVPGIYLLTVYSRTYGPMHGTMFIKKNDQILCHARIGDQATWNTASRTGIAKPSPGDSVRVTGSSDSPIIIHGGRSGFAGHLIQEYVWISERYLSSYYLRIKYIQICIRNISFLYCLHLMFLHHQDNYRNAWGESANILLDKGRKYEFHPDKKLWHKNGLCTFQTTKVDLQGLTKFQSQRIKWPLHNLPRSIRCRFLRLVHIVRFVTAICFCLCNGLQRSWSGFHSRIVWTLPICCEYRNCCHNQKKTHSVNEPLLLANSLQTVFQNVPYLVLKMNWHWFAPVYAFCTVHPKASQWTTNYVTIGKERHESNNMCLTSSSVFSVHGENVVVILKLISHKSNVIGLSSHWESNRWNWRNFSI